MARFGLIGSSYTSQSLNVDCQKTENWYLEKIESEQGKSALALYPTPGTALFVALTDSPIRAEAIINGRMFAVAGATLFELFSDGTSTNRGAVAKDAYPATISTSATQMLIVSAGVSYSYILATNTLAVIAGMLGTPSMGGFSDGYFIVLLKDTNTFQISNLEDVTTWDALDVTTVSEFPDNIVSMIIDHREIWLLGLTKSIGYENTGNADFPFEPIQSAYIEQGCGAKFSPCRMDNSFFFWGADERGSMIAWRMQGYLPVRISNHAIEFAVQGYSTSSDAVSYTYQDQGHSFWVTYFPTANKTWVYDASTGQWHERSYLLNGVQTAHRSQCHVFAFGKHLVGDWASGNIYQLAIPKSDGAGGWLFVTDAGNPIRRVRRAPVISNENTRIFHSKITIDVETGLGPIPALTDGAGNNRAPQLMLRWSDNSGHTWSNEYLLNCGQGGEYRARAIKRRLGQSRNRVYEISASDAIPWRIVEGYVEASPGYGVTERVSTQMRKGA
jgi:hypothetical protein